MLTNKYYSTHSHKLAFLFLLMVLFITSVIAQDTNIPAVSKAEQTQVIDSLTAYMKTVYVFPEVGDKVALLLNDNLKKGVYDSLTDPMMFSERLTHDIRSANNDLHLGVFYDPQSIAMQKGIDQNDEKARQQSALMSARDNYGFKEVKILPGNVGYLKFNMFNSEREAFDVAAGAIGFLSHCDAIIFDLRDNGGGDPVMIQFLTTYLFKQGDARHLNSFYVRQTGATDQFWTLPVVPGNRMPDVDIYVLTSSNTFSGAEEFSYNLKNMKRGTIVGETTGGGAHPVNFFNINDHFIAKISYGRAINPISKTNWEGTGVEPDVKVPRSKALDTAYKLALQKIIAKTDDENYKSNANWAMETLDAKLTSVSLTDKQKKSYIGEYGPRSVILDKGELYYERKPNPRFRMIPLSEDYFRFDEVDYFRLKVIVKDGKVIRLEGHYVDGRTDVNDRTK